MYVLWLSKKNFVIFWVECSINVNQILLIVGVVKFFYILALREHLTVWAQWSLLCEHDTAKFGGRQKKSGALH